MFSTIKSLLFLFFAGVTLISAVEYSVGSAHPYTNSLRQYTPVYVNGAIGYYVRFDNRSSTVSGDQDYVSLYKNNAYNTYWGSPYYSGALNSGAWSPSDTLTIYNSSFIVYFHTDSSGTSWGYKLYYTPIFVGPIPVQEVLIIGSPHNYWASIDVYTTICIPGATGYNIVFDDRSSTVSGDQDYMTIFQDATHTTYWGSPYYAGPPSSGAWPSNNNLTIYSSSFVVRFHSDSSGGSYGYRMYVYALSTPVIPMQELLIVGSPHNYWNSLDFYTAISIPGAAAYIIRFDNKSSTLSGSDVDYLSIYHDKSLTNFWGSPYYAGPTSSGAWNIGGSLTIYNSSFILHFHSDSSGGDYGFKMYITAIAEGVDVPIQELLVLDSPHSYWGSMNFYATISIPNAIGYYVRFDNRSSTESGNPDYLNIYKDSTYSTYWGSPYYGGYLNSGAWPSDNYLTIFASSFVIHFASDSSGSSYGFKMYVYPVGSAQVLQQTLLEIGSPHNYWNSMNFYTTIAMPNAVAYNLRFDELSSTESGYPDTLSIYKDSTYTTYWGSPYYGGLAGSGAWNPTYNLTVFASSFILHFKSDSSGTSWGFKLYITPILNSADVPSQQLLLIGSPHPYWASMNVYTAVNVPNAIGYNVNFDNRTCFEVCSTPCDYVTLYQTPLLVQYYGNGTYSECSAKYFNNFRSFYIPSSTFTIFFRTDSSSSAWGYMLNINAVFNTTKTALHCPINSTVSTSTAVVSGTNSDLGVVSSSDNESCVCNSGYSSSFDGTTILHRYSFDNDATDSIGQANGQLSDGAYILESSATILYSTSTSSLKPCVNISTGLSTTTASISFEAWLSTGGSNAGSARIFQFGQTQNSNSKSLAVNRNSQSGVISASVYNAAGTAFTVSSTVGFNSLSNAYIAVTFSKSLTSLSISIYDNGKLVGSGYSTSYSIPSVSVGYVGRSFLSSDVGSEIMVNELRIWNGTLTANDVQESYQTGLSNLPCPPCSMNSYASTNGMTFCIACPPHSTTSRIASEYCSCKAGYNSSGFANTLTCTACPGGYYSSFGDLTCTMCLGGTYSAKAAANCSTTPAGYISSDASDSYSPCPANTFSTNGSTTCSACPYGSFSSEASSTCLCAAGYLQTGLAHSLSCSVCPVKTFSPSSGSTACSPCPPGTYSSGSGGTSCPICPQGTYSNDIGESITCASCPAGQTTANPGASSADECLNPTANFVLGVLLLPLCLAVVFYLTLGRIHWVAEVRRFVFAVKIAELLNRVYATLQLAKKKEQEETRSNDAERVSKGEHMMIFLRTWAFFFTAATYLILNMLIYFILNVNRIFFSSMIIAKSYQRSNADLDYSTYVDSIKLWVAQIDQSNVFFVFSFLKLAFVPILYLLEGLYFFNIDFSAINLTCNGALAPAELCLNLVILLAVVIIICADYPLLFSQTVSKANLSFSMWASGKVFSVSSFKEGVGVMLIALLSFTLWMFAQLNPLQSAMQYMMTLVTISSFVQDSGHHPITPACNSISTAPNIDAAIGYLATIVAYMLIGPALYTVSVILHPGLPSQVSGFGLMRRLDYSTVKEGEEQQQKSIFRFFSVDFFLLGKLVQVSETQVKLVDAVVDAGGTSATAGTFDGEELPSLLNLVLNSKEELDERFPRLGFLNWVLALSPVGQCLTPTGYYCWICVAWKYWQFLLLSFGIWTEASYRCFNFPDRVLELVKGDMLGEDFVDAVGTVVAAKAILWQIIPPLSLLSIYSMNTSSSPIYTSSIEDFQLLSPNFFVANVLGSPDSSGEEDELQQWQKILKKVSDLFTVSRPFKLAVNIINFFLSTGIVFLSTSSWKESALFYAAISVLLFNTFMRGLSVVVDLGSSKFLFVSDDDIRIALCFAKRKSGEQDDQATDRIILQASP